MVQVEEMGGKSGLGLSDRVRIALAFLSLVPLILVLFLGLGAGSPLVVAVVAGSAIIAAGYCLAWGTEALQFVVPQALALAVLAVLQVLPEYSIEALLAYHGAFDQTILGYATASMTGANRLLLGLGWPAVVIISFLAARRRGEKDSRSVTLDFDQASGVFFLFLSTLYSFAIVFRRTLSVLDAVILVLIYAGYVYVAQKSPALDIGELERAAGPPRVISSLPAARRYGAIAALLLFGCLLIAVASNPFIASVLGVGKALSINQYFLMQWLAPVLTEFPEAITAASWAVRVRMAPVAISNLVSSKVNQWTLLLGTIPAVYAVAIGGFQPIQLTGLQVDEMLITSAQSLYGCVCMFDLKFGLREASLLLGLFLLQFFVPPLRVEVTVAFLALAAIELASTHRRFEIFSNIRTIVKGFWD